MKKHFLLYLLTVLLSMVGLKGHAYSFAVQNEDGVTIYYGINSADNSRVYVTYKTTSYNSYTGTVIIPSTVTYNGTTYDVTGIGQYAFKNCSNLTNVSIPSSVKSIGSYAFSYCKVLTSIIIPSSVTSIGTQAFEHCEIVTNLTIPSSVTSIGNSAFFYCKGLKNLTISEGVTSIGSGAFSDCSGLTSVTIPESVTSIGQRAFSDCTSLKSVAFFSNLSDVSGTFIFDDCTSLNTFYCYSKTPPDIKYNIFFYDGNLFPDMILFVPYGYKNAYLMSGPWYQCKAIIEMGNGNEDGGEYWMFSIFGSDASITGHVLPSGDLTIPSTVYLNNYAYDVTSIASCAFQNCNNLTSVTIPDGVTSIGENAFDGCSGLTSVTIPESVTEIGESAIPTSATIYVPYGKKDYYQNLLGSSYTVVEMASPYPRIVFADPNVKAICVANWDTSDDGEIDEVEAAAVTSLGTVFKNNSSITSFDELQYFTGLTSIESTAFKNCTSLRSVNLPEGLTSIGGGAFWSCFSLKSIIIPSSVSSIDGAFIECPSLSSIVVNSDNTVYDSRNDCNAIIETATNTLILGCKNTIIPNTVTSIGKDAFSCCYSLTSVIIPDGVTGIGEHAFSSCSGLTSVTIPSSVTEIGAGAFVSCSALTSVYSNMETPPSIDANCFTNRANATLYVPEGTKSVYEAAPYWCEFEIVEIPEEISVAAITLNKSSFTIFTGRTSSVSATILPSDATNQELEWSSSDTSVATVENGEVTGVGNGTATITATATDGSGVSASCQVNVIQLPEEDTDVTQFDNTLYLEPVEGVAGLPTVLSVKMKNTVPIVGYQFTIALPEGITFMLDSEGQPKAELSEERTTKRKTNYFGTTIQADGTLKVLSTTTAGTNGLLYAFDGNDGEVARIKVNIPEEMSAGDYPLLLQNVRLTGQSNEHYSINSLRSNLHVVKVDFLPGDVNGDGEVDVADFTVMANYILGKTPEVFIKSAADIAGGPDGSPDDEIDVADLTGIANIILHSNGGSYGAPRRVAVTPADIDTQDNAIYVEPLTAMPGTQQVLSVRMKNNVDVSGMEFTLQLPEGITIATDADGLLMAEMSNERTTARKTDFFAGSLLGDGMLKVLCASTKENPGTGKLFSFDGNEGEVAYITVNIPADYAEGTYTVSVTNAKTSDPDGVKTMLADTGTSLTIGSATGISHTSDLTPVSSDDYYTLDGQKLEDRPAKKGVYIMNGNKVVIK